MNHESTLCFWCKKPMLQRIDTFARQSKNYGHSCCKKCFGNEPTFREARKRVMTTSNPFKGKTHTPESKEKMAQLATGRIPWNKGVYKKKRPIIPGSINRWMEFKRTIMERDCGTCWKCNTNNRIEVHHIVSKTRYPDTHYDEQNCITLCYWCHKDFHKRFTIKNFTPHDTYVFLNEGREEKDFVFFC
jgi:5-methylcytosine-specific restriction endonuclease McrA